MESAELLIDHAWGWEPCTISDIKAYKPGTNSLGSGQVLQCPYSFEKAKIVVKEMTDLLALNLVSRNLVTNQVVLTVGYDIENLTDSDSRKNYHGEVTVDHYGRSVPKHAHGSASLDQYTSSAKHLTKAVMELFDRKVDKHLLVRRIHVTANNVMDASSVEKEETFEQLNFFTDDNAIQAKRTEEAELAREKKMQEAILEIKQRYGKNAILKGINLMEGATTVDRNKQIGGHKA